MTEEEIRAKVRAIQDTLRPKYPKVTTAFSYQVGLRDMYAAATAWLCCDHESAVCGFGHNAEAAFADLEARLAKVPAP